MHRWMAHPGETWDGDREAKQETSLGSATKDLSEFVLVPVLLLGGKKRSGLDIESALLPDECVFCVMAYRQAGRHT